MTSTIREFRLEDVEFVATLVRESFDRRFWPFMVYCQSGTTEFLKVALRYPSTAARSRSYVSVGADGIEGFAEFKMSGEGEALLSYICVVPNARGRGVATRLIEEFLSTHQEVRRLELDVFTENAPAVNLYRKLGFERVNSSVWVSRPLPDAHGSVEILGLPSSLATHQLYGFCELEVPLPTGSVRVGLVGSDVMNCRTPEIFQDDTLLAALRISFPATNTAFAVVAESDLLRLSITYSIINHTHRMGLDLPAGRPIRRTGM
jgi:ribosomal protein S18 acetylase RimI-like enzyme